MQLLPFLLLLATADPAYQRKVDALLRKAIADRKAKGLDPNAQKLEASWPPAEVAAPPKPVEACPGASVPVSFTGKFVAGTSFVVMSDDVDVKEEKGTATTWQARLEVKPTATPHTVQLVAITPVSGAQRTFTVLNIACKQVWSMVLDTGDALTVHTEWKTGKGARGTAEWTKPAQKADPCEVDVSGSTGSFVFERVVTQAESDRRMQATQQALNSPQGRDISRRRGKANLALDECSHKWPDDPAKLIECMGPVQAELNAVTKEQEALIKKATGGPKAGCEQVTVDVTDGKLTGMGDRCFDGKTHKVTGTVKGEP